MSCLDCARLQTRLDAIAYPPTHHYNIETLQPIGILADRAKILHNLAPDFFIATGEHMRMLDVGCNKGFFSGVGADVFSEVVGIDTGEHYVKLCQDVAAHAGGTTTFVHTGFRDFITTKPFDRVLMGNVHHYVHTEANGWDWVRKLALLTKPGGIAIIEGPVDASKCADLNRPNGPIAEHLKEGYTEERFLAAMAPWFVLCGVSSATMYTPDRYVYCFVRRAEPFDLNTVELEDLDVKFTIAGSPLLVVFHTEYKGQSAIAKVYTDAPVHFPMQSRIAGMTPFSTTLLAKVVQDGRVIGWLEAAVPYRFFDYREAEHAVLLSYCKRQIALSRIGYFDEDPGTLNWAQFPDGVLINADKNSIFPIRDITPEQRSRFLKTFIPAYRQFAWLGPEMADAIVPDSKSIERYFAALYERLHRP